MQGSDERKSQELVERFKLARTDHALAVLEGFHAVKHALRFDAELLHVVAVDRGKLAARAAELAPDLADRLLRLPAFVPVAVFEQLSPSPPPSGVMAIVGRRLPDLASVLNDAK
ncbi:MAG TPA: RNA methyltransferase substrate-binding domain-containing protein, partial [Candidatus Saccharimonadales bacterium]|nr:RNA methyltransferase substrate-binding domain-containing protein [Candidatus Saccharimonadales bacterium]